MKKISLLLYLLTTSMLFCFSQGVKVVKGDKAKFDSDYIHRKKAHLFKYKSNYYIVDMECDRSGNRNFIAMAKFNEDLKLVKKYSYLWKKKSDTKLPINYRLTANGELAICYYVHKDENCKFYFQYIDLEKLALDGEPKLFADYTTSNYRDWYDYHTTSYISENEKFMLLKINVKTIQHQLLFDEKNNLLYDKQLDIDYQNVMLDNNGNTVIAEEISSDAGQSSDESNFLQFKITKVDAEGNEEVNIFQPKILKHGMNVSTSYIIEDFHLKNYKFMLRNDHLHFAAFPKCNVADKNVSVFGVFSKGIYYALLDLRSNCKIIKELREDFNKTTSEQLMNHIYAIEPKTASKRKEEFDDIKKCNNSDLPVIFADEIWLDSFGNISIVGSSFTNLVSNIYAPGFISNNFGTIYDYKNTFIFHLGNDNKLSDKTDLFIRDIHFRKISENVFFMSKPQGNNYYVIYDQYQFENQAGDYHDHKSSYQKYIKVNFGYLKRTPQGELFFIRTAGNNSDAERFRLYKITVE